MFVNSESRARDYYNGDTKNRENRTHVALRQYLRRAYKFINNNHASRYARVAIPFLINSCDTFARVRFVWKMEKPTRCYRVTGDADELLFEILERDRRPDKDFGTYKINGVYANNVRAHGYSLARARCLFIYLFNIRQNTHLLLKYLPLLRTTVVGYAQHCL